MRHTCVRLYRMKYTTKKVLFRFRLPITSIFLGRHKCALEGAACCPCAVVLSLNVSPRHCLPVGLSSPRERALRLAVKEPSTNLALTAVRNDGHNNEAIERHNLKQVPTKVDTKDRRTQRKVQHRWGVRRKKRFGNALGAKIQKHRLTTTRLTAVVCKRHSPLLTKATTA